MSEVMMIALNLVPFILKLNIALLTPSARLFATVHTEVHFRFVGKSITFVYQHQQCLCPRHLHHQALELMKWLIMKEKWSTICLAPLLFLQHQDGVTAKSEIKISQGQVSLCTSEVDVYKMYHCSSISKLEFTRNVKVTRKHSNIMRTAHLPTMCRCSGG